MAVLMLKKSLVDDLTDHQRRVSRLLSPVRVGSPFGPYTPDGVNLWFLYESEWWTCEDAAYGAVLLRELLNVPTSIDVPQLPPNYPEDQWEEVLDETRAELRAWIEEQGVVWPITIPEGEDPWEYVLSENNAPAELKMFESLPETWSVVEL